MKYSVNKSAHVFAVAERKIRDQREKQRACGYFYMVRLTEPLYETFHVYTPPENCVYYIAFYLLYHLPDGLSIRRAAIDIFHKMSYTLL